MKFLALLILCLIAVLHASLDPRCSQSVDAGTECDKPKEIRYAYRKRFLWRRCEQFTYNGCGGNENNFENLDACKRTCSA